MKRRNEIIYTDSETYTPDGEAENESVAADEAKDDGSDYTPEMMSFAEVDKPDGKKRRGGIKTKLIVIGSVLLAAVLLIGGYFLFLYEPETETEPDKFYILTDAASEAVAGLDGKGTIAFSSSAAELIEDEYGYIAYTFAKSVEKAGRVKVETGEGGAFVTVSMNGESVEFGEDELFRALPDGTKYAFDGESLYVNALLKLDGKDGITLPLRALNGYDTDGDTVTSTGKPFMYPAISRSDVQSITVANQSGSYKIYRYDSSTFYMENAEGVDFNSEMFSYLVVSSTYTCAESKISNPKDFSEYGLDGDGSTAKVTVVTTGGDTHVIVIGDTDSSGSYKYARCDDKPFVYLLLAGDVASTFEVSGESYLTANLVYSISDTNEIYGIDKMTVYYRDTETAVNIRLQRKVSASNNLKVYGDADLATLITDLKRMSGTYSDWTEDEAFAAFTTDDGKTAKIAIALCKYAADGEYKVRFTLVRDEDNDAYLPDNVKLLICTDGSTFNSVDASVDMSGQKDGTCRAYEMSFTSKDPVLYVRLDFEGVEKGKYVVTDEIRILADGKDANPADAFTGLWMMKNPAEFIPEGRNFAYVDTTNYCDFLLSVCALVGDRVEHIGIDEETLVRYGLDEPAIQIHYTYGSYDMDILLSDPDENGGRFAASMITTVHEGEEVKYVNPYVAYLSLETAAWMDWDAEDFLSHTLISMYIDDVDAIDVSFNGNDYRFDLVKEEGTLSSVTCNGNPVDLRNFRYLYVSIINVTLEGKYTGEDAETSEMLRIKVHSETKTDEIVFYRVSSTKAYYTIDGTGQYYTLVYDIMKIENNLALLLAGEEVPH